MPSVLRGDIRQIHVNDALAAIPKDKELENQLATEEQRMVNDYASLSEHSGYNRLKKVMEEDIADLFNGKRLAAMSQAGVSNEALGEALKVEHLAAERLQKYIRLVEMAAKAVEEQRNRRGRPGAV